jgi:hypothetical protein
MIKKGLMKTLPEVGKIKTGYKKLMHADPEKNYTMEELKATQGLLGDAIWFEALTKIGDHQLDYIRAVLRRGTPFRWRQESIPLQTFWTRASVTRTLRQRCSSSS